MSIFDKPRSSGSLVDITDKPISVAMSEVHGCKHLDSKCTHEEECLCESRSVD